MKIVILFALNFLMLSCLTTNTNQKALNNHILDIEQQINRDISNGEDFNSFFVHFKSDTIFQLERVKLPFEFTKRYMKPNGATIDSVSGLGSKDEWVHCTFLLNDSNSFPFQIFQTNGDTVNIIFKETKYDLYSQKGIEAVFIRDKGKWYNKSLLKNIGAK